MQGNIINITRYCTDDGPGIRTTVFLKGCPLRCIWCHNPESQEYQVEQYISGEIIGRSISAQEVLEEVVKDKVFYDVSGGGVTVSGGEPLFQPLFTAEILRLCKENGIHTAMETSGYADQQVFLKVLEYCDLVLFDIKETDNEKHRRFTGVSLEMIMKNLRQLEKAAIPFFLRLPVIPGLNDRKEHLLTVKKLVQELEHCQGAEIMTYHVLGAYKYERLGRKYLCSQIEEPSKAQVEEWRGLIGAK